MIYLVKCFSIVKVDRVRVLILEEILKHYINMAEELSEAVTVLQKSVLVFAQEVISVEMIHYFICYNSFADFDGVGGRTYRSVVTGSIFGTFLVYWRYNLVLGTVGR